MKIERDAARMVATRVMDRIERDGAIHADALADEIIAGFALVGPVPGVTPKPMPGKDAAIEAHFRARPERGTLVDLYRENLRSLAQRKVDPPIMRDGRARTVLYCGREYAVDRHIWSDAAFDEYLAYCQRHGRHDLTTAGIARL